MGETQWTQAQTEAINAQGSNVLVSAAAGSGKTAVLVERVIRMITRSEDPLDISRLVIVTFTRAAAAQMKSRIFGAIKEKLREGEGNARLADQLMKVQSARICTIDSLCSEIVRDNIQDVDLDPDFRIADEAQLNLIRRDVLKAMLEDCYDEADPSFMDLVQYYTDKNDNMLEDIILTLYSFSQSHPEPFPWLRSCAYPYLEAQSLTSGENYTYPDGTGNWMEAFAGVINERTLEIRSLAQSGIRIAKMTSGPWQYEDVFRNILDFTYSLEGQSFDNRVYALRSYLADWPAAPRITKKNIEVDEDLKACAMEIRKEIKKRLEDLRDNFLYDDLENIYAEMAACAPVAKTLSELVIRFSREYAGAKKQKKIADFSDVAHYALKILIRYNDQGEIERDENGEPVYTETADIMAGTIDQVIVDEYQDTNMLQEYLVKALSGERSGNPNVFMVGDVKQSIYGFRMACPELFNEKLSIYEQDPGEEGSVYGRKIILDRNFRSNREILDFTNLIFRRTMIREVGGIEYTDGHALVCGREDCPDAPVPEVMMLQGSGEQAKLLEGYMVSSEIEKLVSEAGCRYSDIVILTRTSDNPQLERILYERGIPVIKNSGQGFFDSFEIRLLLDLLNIIDNPFQDIPFAAVLYSPICNVSAADLARIRLCGSENDSLYECLVKYCDGEGRRLKTFCDKLENWRDSSYLMRLYDLIDCVLEGSGLLNIIPAMPRGADRLANIDMFKSKADDFARGGYTGLFEFLEFMNGLKDMGIDFGSRTCSDSFEDAVRMMTIHRSKGLEFPVVFIAGCGKKYNDTDLNASIIPDRVFGVGLEKRDPDTRMIKKTAFMQTVRQKKRTDLYAEEMRLLYVAMTRAKERLFITGTDRQLESRIRTWEQPASPDQDRLSPYEIMRSSSFLSLTGAALHKYKDADAGFVMKYLEDLDIEGERVQEVLENDEIRQTLVHLAQEDTDISKISSMLDYRYPYLKAAHVLGKITASDLENKDIDEHDYRMAAKEDPADHEDLSGAELGTAYHRFFELMDYSRDIKGQLEAFERQGLMTTRQVRSLDENRILEFIDSSTGQRMAAAHAAGRLYREQQFVMGTEEDINKIRTVSGEKYNSDTEDKELLLVQGIVDAFFIEQDENGDDHIILVDYKTDRVLDPEYYIKKYSPQLNIYSDALQRSTTLKVTQKIIYAQTPRLEILVP